MLFVNVAVHSSHPILDEQTLTFHILELGIIRGEKGKDSLRFPVTVYIQLQIGQHGAERGDDTCLKKSFKE